MSRSSTLLSGDYSLTEAELVSSLPWLIALRWWAGSGVIAATWFSATILELNIPAASLYMVGAGLLVYNTLVWWGWDRLKIVPSYFHRLSNETNVVYQWFTRFQIGLDWVAMVLLVHFSGGIESPAILYFLFHITIASLLLPHNRGFFYVTLAPILVGGIALLEYHSILPHVYIFEPARYTNVSYIAATLFFFTSAAYALAYFSMTISKRLRRRENELTALYKSLQAITSTLELTEVLDRLSEATTKVFQCKGAAIRLLDETGHYLEWTGSYGMSQAYQDKTLIEVTRDSIDEENLAGKTVIVADAAHDNRLPHPDRVAAEGIHSILSAPLISKRGPTGVLRAYCATPNRFTQEDAAFLQAIASHGTVAIENAQAYHLLENLDKSKSQFIRIVTHELRSPAQVTSSLLNILSRGYVGKLNEKQVDMVNRAQRRIQFLQTLINDLLDLAAGKAQLTKTTERDTVSLTATLKEIRTRFEASALDKGLTLQLKVPDEALYIWANKNELDRMISNLVNNAIKYTHQGNVCILLKKTGGMAYIAISDTGIGISQEALPQLFEEFFRAKNAKAVEEAGTGLGLSIVKDLVEQYNGKISVQSIKNQGTTFSLTLPLPETSPPP